MHYFQILLKYTHAHFRGVIKLGCYNTLVITPHVSGLHQTPLNQPEYNNIVFNLILMDKHFY